MVLKGKITTLQSEQSYLSCCQSEARALKVFSGPDQGPVAVANVTIACSETNTRGNTFGMSTLTGPVYFVHLGHSFFFFLSTPNGYLPSYSHIVPTLQRESYLHLEVSQCALGCLRSTPPSGAVGDTVTPAS